MMRWAARLAGRIAAALGGGLLLGCIVDLTAIPSCGDGFVDEAAGEQCDPGQDGGPPCDPQDCVPLTDYCGNGVVDGSEQCDGGVGGRTCPSGKGFLDCNADCTFDLSLCDLCGDGKIDPGEECDGNPVDIDGFTQVKNCSELTSFPQKPYASGQTNVCTPECMWYRGPCSYCGNNTVEGALQLDLYYPDQVSTPETCDGSEADIDALRGFCDDRCPAQGLECKPRCQDDCSSFDVPNTIEELECCVPTGDPCPSLGDVTPCCVAYGMRLDDPFDPSVCQLQKSLDGHYENVCK